MAPGYPGIHGLRNAEQKSANQKNQTRKGATAHCKSRTTAIAINHNPRPRSAARRSGTGESGPELGSRGVGVDDGCTLIETSSELSASLTTFGNLRRKKSSHSLFLRIGITSGFPDVSMHIHSFGERSVSRFSNPMCKYPASGFSLTSRPRARPLPFVLQTWRSPESNQDIVSARNQGNAVK